MAYSKIVAGVVPGIRLTTIKFVMQTRLYGRQNCRHFIPMLIGGVWLLAHGVPTLVGYLRTYPAPKGEVA
jgi:hypothetical protein